MQIRVLAFFWFVCYYTGSYCVVWLDWNLSGSPGWRCTHRDLPAAASRMLRLKVCAHMPSSQPQMEKWTSCLNLAWEQTTYIQFGVFNLLLLKSGSGAESLKINRRFLSGLWDLSDLNYTDCSHSLVSKIWRAAICLQLFACVYLGVD